jgi:hypothetical protein
LQDPSQTNGDDLNNVRLEAYQTFRNEIREYLKEKVNEFETNIKTNISETYVEA